MNSANENWYRTGAVAKMLGTSQHRIRELARAGVIGSEVRNGYRYIPATEVERLRKEGIPPMPANMEPEPANDAVQSANPPRPARGTPELYAEPSRQLAQSKEKLIRLEHEAQGKRIQKEIREMDRADQEERHRAREARNIEEWRQRYKRQLVATLPAELCARACTRMDAILNGVPPYTDVSRQMSEIVASELAPLREREARLKALASHRERMQRFVSYIVLPCQATSDEREEARAAALAHLIERVPIDEPDWQVRKEVAKAIQPVVDRVERRRAEADHQSRIASKVEWCILPDANYAEGQDAKWKLRAALERLPATATTAEVEVVQEQVLAPIKAAIKERKQREEKEQQEREDRERKGREERSEQQRKATQASSDRLHVIGRIDAILSSRIAARLERLEREGEVDFDDDWDFGRLRDKVAQTIRPILIEELAARPEMPDEDLKKRIAKLVSEHYGAFCVQS
jgi:hypothetical protein